MLSTQSIFKEIRNNRDAYALLMSIAAKGETQGGWENERIASLTLDEALAAKIRRHGADETKHGLLFSKLLRRVGLENVSVPANSDYCRILESSSMGLPHARLQQDRPLSDDELLVYLAHSKITEERAAEEVAGLLRVFAEDAELAPTLALIADDEINHLSFVQEELIEYARRGHRSRIEALLKAYAFLEIAVYRDVGLAFVASMAKFLGWSAAKQFLLRMGVWGVYLLEKLFTWRRLVRLRPPARVNAMGGPACPRPAR